MNGILLLIASDSAQINRVQRACADIEVEVRVVSSVDEADLDGADVIICSDTAFERIRSLGSEASIIVYGDASDSRRAIEAIKEGAFDYFTDPVSPDELSQQVRAALRLSRDVGRPATYERPTERSADVDRIIGQSPAMQGVYKAIGRIAPRDINVLITGESGTGKELVARAIVHHSPRRDRPFLAVNCAAIPDTLLESELFGHEKGAFTGAERRHVGKFEQCDGGTLFLDEIGDIPLATQAKLLRVLQDQTFQRVGGVEVLRCDVRIIAATHQPLDELMSERRFRQDLYYRLSIANIHVPPLREREVDVVLLAHYFVDCYNSDFETQIQAFAPETLRALLQYDWPGNVRQLENVIRATLVHAHGTVLRPEFLPEAVLHGAATGGLDSSDASPIDEGSLESSTLAAFASHRLDGGERGVMTETVGALERELIRAALRRHGGRIAPAARHLGISRTTLRRKMGQHGIAVTTT